MSKQFFKSNCDSSLVDRKSLKACSALSSCLRTEPLPAEAPMSIMRSADSIELPARLSRDVKDLLRVGSPA